MKFKFVILLASLCTATGAVAEDAAPNQPPQENAAPAPAEPQQPVSPAQPQKFYFEVEQGDLAVISQALNEMPYRLAAPLLLKLNGQLSAQTQIVAAKESVEKAKKARSK